MKKEEQSREIAVFVNGPCWLTEKEILEHFSGSPEIICADGGANILYPLGLTPELIIGDFDSIRPEVYEYYKNKCEIKRHPVKKDRSDLEIIFDYISAREQAPPVVKVFGALGGRIDHQLGHLQLLEKAHDAGMDVSLVSRGFMACIVSGEREIKGNPGDIVSIFAVTPYVSGITLKGFEYEGESLEIKRGTTLGLSNSLLTGRGIISIGEGKALVFHLKNAPQNR